MDIFDKYATDEKLEVDGAWIDWGEGVRLRIARMNNDRYVRMRDRMTKPFRSTPAGIPEKKAEEILIACAAHALLVGWDGPLRFKGELLGEYTEEKARKLLAIKDFRAQVLMVANEHSVYHGKQLDDAVKKSEATSAGNTATAEAAEQTQTG